MAVLIVFSIICVAAIAFLLLFFLALSREAKPSGRVNRTRALNKPPWETEIQVVPAPRNPERWAPAWISGLRQDSSLAGIDPALFARLLHYYGGKISSPGNRSEAALDWEHVPVYRREQLTAAAALALIEMKTMLQDEEAENGMKAR